MQAACECNAVGAFEGVQPAASSASKSNKARTLITSF
jgi:hypothetical protein